MAETGLGHSPVDRGDELVRICTGKSCSRAQIPMNIAETVLTIRSRYCSPTLLAIRRSAGVSTTGMSIFL